MHIKNIVAIGGGGFGRSLGSLEIEKYIISLVNKRNPRICFIPTASGDNDLYKLNFYRAFSKLNCVTSHIDFFSRTENLEEIVLTQDIIYVGGGNTKSMLAVWKEWKLDALLHKAYLKGTILCGVSAGSICWYEKGVTDSWASNLSILDCLSFLKGNNCPHYDGEKDRRPSVHNFIKDGKIDSCYASDDGAALHFINGELYKSVSFYRDAESYLIKLDSNENIVEKKIPKINLI